MSTTTVFRPKYSTNVRFNAVWRFLVLAGLNVLDRIAPPVAEALIKAVFFRPHSNSGPTEWEPLLERARRFSLRINGRRVAAWQWGDGPAVLLVHGWGSRGIKLGAFIQPLLKQGFSVIAFDGPGHGQSDGRTSSYFEMIDTISAFLDRGAGFNITGIIAHSFGAGAVVRAVAGNPVVRPAVALVAPSLRLYRLLERTFDRYGLPNRLFKRVVRQYEHRFGYRFSQDDPWRHLYRLSRPVFMVHDEGDRVVDFSDSMELAQDTPGVSLHTTSGLGHRRVLFDPGVVDRIVTHICNSQKMAGAHHYE